MKVKILEVREWFKSLSFNEKCGLSKKYYDNKNYNILTDKMLKDCYIKETKK